MKESLTPSLPCFRILTVESRKSNRRTEESGVANSTEKLRPAVLRNQEARQGNVSLRRTVRLIPESGPKGNIQYGLIQYQHRVFLVKKTRPMTWWKVVRPATVAELSLRGVAPRAGQ